MLLHQLIDDPDHLPKAPAQPGQFADDQAIPSCQCAKQVVDAPLGGVLSRGDLRLNEAVDGESLLSRVIEDGHLLVRQILGTRRNAQVGDRFHVTVYKNRKRIYF